MSGQAQLIVVATIVAVVAMLALSVVAIVLQRSGRSSRPPVRSGGVRRSRTRPTAAQRGEQGEALARSHLEADLESTVYSLFHRILVEDADTPSGATELDHVVLSRFGVVVIETKNYSGLIFGQPDDGKWTVRFPDGNQEQRSNPIIQNRGHARALARLAGIDRSKIQDLVYLVGDAEPQTELGPKVCNDRATLIQAVRRAEHDGRPTFNERELKEIHLTLSDLRLLTTDERLAQHAAALKRHYGD